MTSVADSNASAYTSASASAWEKYAAKLWHERVSTYGLLPLPTEFDVYNRFVKSDVIELASKSLEERGIPVRMRKPRTSDKFECVVNLDFVRPPNMQELNITHGQMISEEGDPFWTLNKFTKNRVFTMWSVSVNPRYRSYCNIDEFEIEVDLNDEAAEGGHLYVSFEGNPCPPYKLRLPGSVRVPIHFGTNMKLYGKDERKKWERTVSISLRVHASDGRILSVSSASLSSLFELRTSSREDFPAGGIYPSIFRG